MSQKDRQIARQRAFDARNALAALIHHAEVSAQYREQMLDRLTELWTEADLAIGGEEARP